MLGLMSGEGKQPAASRSRSSALPRLYQKAVWRRNGTAISEEFMTALVRYSWPGNVRELQNLIERSVILSTGAVLTGSIPKVTGESTACICGYRRPTHKSRSGPKMSSPAMVSTWKPFVAGTLEEAKRSHILKTLEQTKGVVGRPVGPAGRL